MKIKYNPVPGTIAAPCNGYEKKNTGCNSNFSCCKAITAEKETSWKCFPNEWAYLNSNRFILCLASKIAASAISALALFYIGM